MKNQYRKKPVVIEAFRNAFFQEIPQWFKDAEKIGENEIGGVWWKHHEIYIMTLEGVMKAEFGDWIIQGVNGEIYPCKDDIFQKTYEKVI